MKATGEMILVVEDQKDMAEGIKYNLELEGYEVELAHDGETGLAKASDGAPSLVLLDLMLPRMSGLDVLRRLRQEGNPTPVIILTAKGQQKDKVQGLELGADDYVVKPFGVEELLARIRAVLRRTRADEAPPADVVKVRDIVLDFRRYVVVRDGAEHALSRFESEILKLLIARRGEVVTRKDLLEKVWGYKFLPTTRTVDNHIARLRKKVEHEPDQPELIQTVHGIGYKFLAADEA